MPTSLRFFILSILIIFCSLNVNASNTPTSTDKKPEFIPVIKKPCYIGCDYLFQFCYYYNISNMENAVTVKEWKVENDLITGKAVADIKAKLLIKMCYQVSLTSAYAVVDQDINLKSEFEFKIKLNGNAEGQCVEYQPDAIAYYSFEYKGDMELDPIPLMEGQLGQDMAEIIQDSVSKAVYESLPDNKRGKRIYCDEEHNETFKDNTPCRCD